MTVSLGAMQRLQNINDELERRRIASEPRWFIEKYFKIRPKIGGIVPLIFNPSQQHIYNVVSKINESRKPARLIILKARQEGVTTLFQALAFERVLNKAYTNGLILAHDKDTAEEIFRMMRVFYDFLPDNVKPKKKHSSKKEFEFLKPLGSKYTIGTARNIDAARGTTLQYFHGSEVSRWVDPDGVMNNLAQVVPNTFGTTISLESTAHGKGNYFEQKYLDAKTNPEKGWTAIFLPWHWMKEYARPLAVGQDIRYTPDERNLVNMYGLSKQQINWRRFQINEMNGDEDAFKEENPINDVEAFLSSGRYAFDPYRVSDCLEKSLTLCPKYEVDGEKNELIETKNGRFHVYEEEECDHEYIIGADCSTGKLISVKENDHSSATVFDRMTGRFVADWDGLIDADKFAVVLKTIGAKYNSAIIAPEINLLGGGLLVATDLKKIYYNIYHRRVPDSANGKITNKIGFHTTSITRAKMIDLLAIYFRNGDGHIYSRRLLQQCMTFKQNDRGRYEAERGCWDDLIIAACISLYVHSELMDGYYPDGIGDYFKIEKAVVVGEKVEEHPEWDEPTRKFWTWIKEKKSDDKYLCDDILSNW